MSIFHPGTFDPDTCIFHRRNFHPEFSPGIFTLRCLGIFTPYFTPVFYTLGIFTLNFHPGTFHPEFSPWEFSPRIFHPRTFHPEMSIFHPGTFDPDTCIFHRRNFHPEFSPGIFTLRCLGIFTPYFTPWEFSP